MDTINKYLIYENDYDRIVFAKRHRELREKRNLTREQYGQLIGKDQQQVRRYEEIDSDNFQIPPIDVFCKICEIFQVDPKYLLNVNERDCSINPLPNVIYEYTIKKLFNVYRSSNKRKKYDKKMIWKCHQCNNNNIKYEPEFIVDEMDIRFLSTDLQCEHCYNMYDKIINKEFYEQK